MLKGVEKGVVCVLTNKIRMYLAGRDLWRMDTTTSVPHIVNVFGESEEAVFFFHSLSEHNSVGERYLRSASVRKTSILHN